MHSKELISSGSLLLPFFFYKVKTNKTYYNAIFFPFRNPNKLTTIYLRFELCKVDH